MFSRVFEFICIVDAAHLLFVTDDAERALMIRGGDDVENASTEMTTVLLIAARAATAIREGVFTMVVVALNIARLRSCYENYLRYVVHIMACSTWSVSRSPDFILF
jgi:hypothetical protein